jgi:hypothetical protein
MSAGDVLQRGGFFVFQLSLNGQKPEGIWWSKPHSA